MYLLHIIIIFLAKVSFVSVCTLGMAKTFPVGFLFLTGIPNGYRARTRRWLVNPRPSGAAIRKSFLSADHQEKQPFPVELSLSAQSWWLAVRNMFPDGFGGFPGGFWPSGKSCSLVVKVLFSHSLRLKRVSLEHVIHINCCVDLGFSFVSLLGTLAMQGRIT